MFVDKLTKIENVGQRFDKIAASVPKRTIQNLTTLSTSINKSIYMYVWYLPELLLMIAEEDVVNKLVKTRRLIQEQDIETIPSKSNKIKN